MITLDITADAEAASARYKTLIEGWRGLFIRSIDAADFGTPATIARLVDQAYDMARSYNETELALVEQRTKEIALEAHRDALDALRSQDARELTDDITEHAEALYRYLTQEIAIQINRDIAFLRQAYVRVVLQVRIAARAQRSSMRSALLQYRIGNAVELNFFFHDRRNQRWPSQKFVRAIWRQHLLSTYNETVLIDLAEHGQRIAQVRHTDPQAAAHDMRIALSSNTSLPTYAEIRNEIFHPNSEAILTVAEPA